MTEQRMIKYPRTPHLEGSRMQPGDEDLSQIPFAEIAGRNLAVEEKCDGANSAISFSAEGELLLQSRGHYLTGGYREREFNLMKQWAAVHRDAFYRVLGSRAKVTETIDNDNSTGAVYVDGKTWTARSAEGDVIPAGEQVEVASIEGVKLLVIPVKEGGFVK